MLREKGGGVGEKLSSRRSAQAVLPGLRRGHLTRGRSGKGGSREVKRLLQRPCDTAQANRPTVRERQSKKGEPPGPSAGWDRPKSDSSRSSPAVGRYSVQSIPRINSPPEDGVGKSTNKVGINYRTTCKPWQKTTCRSRNTSASLERKKKKGSSAQAKALCYRL